MCGSPRGPREKTKRPKFSILGVFLALLTEMSFTTSHYYPKYEVWVMENFHGRIPFSLSTSLIPLHYCKVLLFGLYKDKDCLLNKLTTPRSVVEDVMPIIWRKLKCSICKNCLKRQVEENLLIYQGHDIYHDHENPHLIFMSIKLITFPQSFDRVLLYTGIRQALDKGVALSGSLQVIYCQAVTVQTIILVKK